MKRFALLLALAMPLSAAWSQLPASVKQVAPASFRVQTEGDFLNFLLQTAWSWERSENPAEEINFFDDGTAQHTSFLAKFKVKNSHEVELEFKGHTAKLVFDPTYASYQGTDFDGTTPIHGTRKNDPAASLARPPASVSFAQMARALVENTWTFRVPKYDLESDRKFNVDGSWSIATDPHRGTWKIQGNKLFVTLASKPDSPEVYHLPPRVFNPEAHKIHLEGSGANLDAVKLDLADASRTLDEKPASKVDESYFGTKRP